MDEKNDLSASDELSDAATQIVNVLERRYKEPSKILTIVLRAMAICIGRYISKAGTDYILGGLVAQLRKGVG